MGFLASLLHREGTEPESPITLFPGYIQGKGIANPENFLLPLLGGLSIGPNLWWHYDATESYDELSKPQYGKLHDTYFSEYVLRQTEKLTFLDSGKEEDVYRIEEKYYSYYGIGYTRINSENSAPGLLGLSAEIYTPTIGDLVVAIDYYNNTSLKDITERKWIIVADFQDGDLGIILSDVKTNVIAGKDWGDDMLKDPRATEVVRAINNNGEYIDITPKILTPNNPNPEQPSTQVPGPQNPDPEQPQNDQWTGKDDRVSTNAGAPVDIDVTANDRFPANADVNIYAWGQPANGTVTWNGTGFTYTPNDGFSGTDSFTYGLHDGAKDNQTMTPQGVTVVIQVGGESNSNSGVTGSIGTGASNYFGGTSFDDIIIFTGGTGNYADGRGGSDTIVFSEAISRYSIEGQGSHFVITDNTLADEGVQFIDIEYVSFDGAPSISLASLVANSGYQRWLGKIEQFYKWIFCLTAARNSS